MPTTHSSISKTHSGRKRLSSPLPSTTIARKRKLSNVDKEPAQAKKKKKTSTKTSEKGKGKALKKIEKELKPKKGKKSCVLAAFSLLWLLTSLGEKRLLCEPLRMPLLNARLTSQGE
jgi:hypothetical protein